MNNRIADKLAVTIALAIIAICIFLVLPGCSTVEKYGTEAIQASEEAADQFLSAAEKAYCDGPTDGALSRRYGGDTEIQTLRNDLCQAVRQKHYSR